MYLNIEHCCGYPVKMLIYCLIGERAQFRKQGDESLAHVQTEREAVSNVPPSQPPTLTIPEVGMWNSPFKK